VRKRAEIRPDQYQNGDMNRKVEIEQNVTIFFARSYVMVVFLRNSMFNTFPTF
jgi:hypothetical protein